MRHGQPPLFYCPVRFLLEEFGGQAREAALRVALALEVHLQGHLARLLDDVILLRAGRDGVLGGAVIEELKVADQLPCLFCKSHVHPPKSRLPLFLGLMGMGWGIQDMRREEGGG